MRSRAGVPRIAGCFWTGAVLSIAASLTVGCARELRLTIAYTHNANGRLEPCACPGNPNGGFARRGTVFERLRMGKDPVLFVDAGDLTPWEDDKLLAAHALEAATMLGYDAVAPGERDLYWDLGRELPEAHGQVPWVCANVARRDGGGRIARAWGVREIAGRRIAFVGLMGTQATAFLPAEHQARFEVVDEERAFRAAYSKLRGEVALIVVLSHRGWEADLELARKLPGGGVWISGHGGDESARPTNVGKWIVARAGENGESVGVLRLLVGEDAVTLVDHKLEPLSPAVPDQTAVAGVVARYRRAELERWEDELLSLREAAPMSRAESCGACHPAQYRQWKASPHAHAIATLRKAGKENVPECLRCHTTDVDMDTKPLPEVQCLACHNVDLEPEMHGRFESKVQDQGKSLCLTCHIPSRSPRFDYPRWLARVKH